MTYQDQEATGSISANFSRVSKTAIPNRYITSPSPDGASHEVTHQADRKSTRLNSSHHVISYAVFCLKKKRILEAAEALPLNLRFLCKENSSAPEPLREQIASG